MSSPRAGPPPDEAPDPAPAQLPAADPLPHPTKTPERQADAVSGASTPDQVAAFDWADFEARYQKALGEAEEDEGQIIRQAESLARYFRAWASAASAHDDERAVKRLRTRQRYVNLAEEKVAEKQQHYDEVVRAFESALALLRCSK